MEVQDPAIIIKADTAGRLYRKLGRCLYAKRLYFQLARIKPLEIISMVSQQSLFTVLEHLQICIIRLYLFMYNRQFYLKFWSTYTYYTIYNKYAFIDSHALV